MCKCSVGLFQNFNVKFKPEHNEICPSLHYCKLLGDISVSAEEWMDQLRIKVNEGKYQKHNRQLKGNSSTK